MTISTAESKTQYTANGVTTDFATGFKFLEDGHVVVYVDDTVKVLNTDYTLTGAEVDSGGMVSFTAAPADQSQVTLTRVVPATQLVDYISGGPFPAETHERALDKLTMLVQGNQEGLSRALTGPSVDPEDANNTLPPSEERPQTFLAFDVDGNPVYIPYADASIPTAIIEDSYTLSAGELSATFTKVDTRNTGFYVIGENTDQGRLGPGIDYSVTTDTQIALTESYPVGTVVLAVQNDPTVQAKAAFVPDAVAGSAAEINAIRDSLVSAGLMASA